MLLGNPCCRKLDTEQPLINVDRLGLRKVRPAGCADRRLEHGARRPQVGGQRRRLEVRKHPRRNLVTIGTNVGREVQRWEASLHRRGFATQHRRFIEQDLINRTSAGRMILLADLSKRRLTGHQRDHARLMGPIAGRYAGKARRRDDIEPVDHHHLRTQGLEGRADERERERPRRGGIGRSPLVENGSKGMVNHQETERRGRAFRVRLEVTQQRPQQCRRATAPQECPAGDAIRRHQGAPPERERRNDAVAT